MNRYQPGEQLQDGLLVHLILDVHSGTVVDAFYFEDHRDDAMAFLNAEHEATELRQPVNMINMALRRATGSHRFLKALYCRMAALDLAECERTQKRLHAVMNDNPIKRRTIRLVAREVRGLANG